MDSYQLGNTVRVSVTFKDSADAEFDPTPVKLVVTDPDGEEFLASIYVTDPEIVKDDTGDYHADIVPNLVSKNGRDWQYRWYSDGTTKVSGESEFEIVDQKGL